MIRTVALGCLAVGVTATAIFRLGTEYSVHAAEITLAELDRQEAQLRVEIERLQFEVDVLESAPRLKQLSAGRLLLAPGSANQLADGPTLRSVIDPAARLEALR